MQSPMLRAINYIHTKYTMRAIWPAVGQVDALVTTLSMTPISLVLGKLNK